MFLQATPEEDTFYHFRSEGIELKMRADEYEPMKTLIQDGRIDLYVAKIKEITDELARTEKELENLLGVTRAEVRESGKVVFFNVKVRDSLNNIQGRFIVFADLNDVANLTDKQLTEDYEKIAVKHKNVSFVFYNDQKVIRSEVRQRLEKLREQLGSHRIQITQDNAQSVFTRQWVGELIHVSKTLKRGQALDFMPVPFLRRLHRFRYLGDETGLVPVALLYVYTGNKGSRR